MSIDTSKLLKLYRGPKAKLPVQPEANALYFTTDDTVSQLYMGASDGASWKPVYNVIFLDEATSPSFEEVQSPIPNIIYILIKSDGTISMATYKDAKWHYIATTEGKVTTTNEVTLTNKTIDADSNTISNLEVDNFKTGVVISAGSTVVNDSDIASASTGKLISEKAFVEYIQQKFNDRVNGMEFMGSKPASELALLTNGEIGNYYIVSEAGNIGGVDFIQDDKLLVTVTFKDTPISSANFYRIASADINKVVTPDGTQTLTNKTIDASNNTITNIGKEELDPTFITTEIGEGASDNTITTTLGTKTYVDSEISKYVILWQELTEE